MAVKKVDLHIHTTASDGQYTPAQTVERAAAAGVEYLAITDHDTIDGVEEGLRAGETCQVHVIRGIELSAQDDPDLHILGYRFSPTANRLQELCREMRRSRLRQKYRILDFLKQEYDIELPLEEVEAVAGGSSIGRPHFAQILVKRGYVSTVKEAFDRYLDTEAYRTIERKKESAATCIQAVRESNGVAVLAHPWQLRYTDEKLENLVARLKNCGLEGIECYYPKHTAAQVKQYLALAEKYRLYITAGSDFHGEKIKPDVCFTPVELDIDYLL